ncbi:MAG: response regulator [Phycisphaerae bacterium]|nr:response regulator [Phycisphaerae bacterium]
MATKILLVDDDLDCLSRTQLQLEACGYEVVTAEGQKKAEELLASFRPDIAIVNLMMEYMDSGFVLSYHIKKRTPHVPVILVTAVRSQTRLDFHTATEEARSWVKADAMLEKPVRFEQLQREVERLLNNHVNGRKAAG